MDRIFDAFLERQYEDGMALAQASDLLNLVPLPGQVPQRYIAVFICKGLVRTGEGTVTEANRFEVAIWFPPDYLRRADPFEILTYLGPREVFHPNIKAPFICVGKLSPGTLLVDILYQCFEIITFNKVTMREDDALNGAACAWARSNQYRFPVDPRALKRRPLEFRIEPIEEVKRP